MARQRWFCSVSALACAAQGLIVRIRLIWTETGGENATPFSL
jgi:hypothetical protein